ncbi:hypothetical protein LXL04_018035 [Taraxacum kok-saghyz]
MTFANNQNCSLFGAHILNLVVQDGMKKKDKSIHNIRCLGARTTTFTNLAKNAKCESTKQSVLDVSTRCNSTYNKHKPTEHGLVEGRSPEISNLSLMAKDLLAIWISIRFKVGSWTSARVLDSYRSSLGDKTLKCLIRTQDWLKNKRSRNNCSKYYSPQPEFPQRLPYDMPPATPMVESLIPGS